jgi:hypothetical protein
MRRGGLGGDNNPQRIDRAVSGPANLTVLIFAACVIGVIPGLVLPTRAQVQDDRAVKVAFVFNLTKYVEWPHPSQELIVGVMGDGPMAEALPMLLAGRSSESRPIRVVVSPSDAQLESCQLLYIAYSSPKKVLTAIQRVRKMSILTVGDSDSFARDGGMVGLVSTEDHIQIQVNLEATAEGHLKISSRLLELSTIVKTKPGVGN